MISDISGTWEGEMISNWRDPQTCEKPEEIKFKLTITQTLFTFSCVMKTKEMTSRSFAHSYVINDEYLNSITYLYDSNPNQSVIKRNPKHTGTTILEISKDSKKMKGSYYTGRETSGEIIARFKTRKKVMNKIMNYLCVWIGNLFLNWSKGVSKEKWLKY